MGIDFIRSTAHSHTKQWGAEYEHAAEDLFARDCPSQGRSFLAAPMSGVEIHTQESVHIRLVEGRVLVMRDLQPIAEIEKPTLELKESLEKSCGILDAFVEEIDTISNVISIHIGKGVDDDPKTNS